MRTSDGVLSEKSAEAADISSADLSGRTIVHQRPGLCRRTPVVKAISLGPMCTMSDSTIETSGCVEDQRITSGDVQIIVA